MGIRISLFAIDVPAIEEFATHSLGYVMQYYARHAETGQLGLYFNMPESGSYGGVPGRNVYYVVNKKSGYLTEQQVEKNAFLSTPLNQHLVSENTYAFYFLLSRYARLPMIDWVTTISDGHRRWWIGTYLDYAQTVLGKSAAYDRFVSLLQRILSGHNCGTILPPEQTILAIPFSLAPINNLDLRMNFWTPDESAFLCQTIRYLMNDNPAKFEKPLNEVDPDVNYEWNEVIEVLQEILVLETPALSNRLVISFIG